MESAEFVIDRLTEAADPRFAAIIAIYEQAIPPRERKSRAAVEALLSSPCQHVLVASDARQVLALAILYVGRTLAALEYLATAEQSRGRGIGASLFRAVRERSGPLPLIVEVEQASGDPPERAIRERRLEFYRRLGCRMLQGVDFILPLHGLDQHLSLLIQDDRTEIASVEAAEWLRELYVDIYGCPPGDPRLARMIRTLPPILTVD